MSVKTAKIAISLPKNTLSEIEHFRRELGLARSAVMLEAAKLWLHSKEEEELEGKYEAGYKKKPEDSSGVDSGFKAGLSSFTKERW